MKLRFSLQNETYKLHAGNVWRFKHSADAFTKELIAVRNSFAAFQAIVWCDTNYALNVGDTPYYSQRRDAVMLSVRARAALPVRCQIEEMHRDGHCLIADALLTETAVDVMREEPCAVWIEMPIPPETAPGDYTVSVSLYASCGTEDETCRETLTVTVRVLPYTLPDGRDFRIHLDLWQHAASVARAHEVPLWSDAHFALLQKYARSLGELGQKCVTLVVSEAPWSGQGCMGEHLCRANLFEYSILPVTRRQDGTFFYDFGPMQRYIDLCADAGISGELSLYGLSNIWHESALPAPAPDYPDGLRVRYFDEADGVYRYMRRAEDIDGYIRAIEAYFVATGQIERVRVAADEPADTEAYRRSLTHIRAIAPKLRFKAAINHAEFIEAFGEEVDDYVPYIEGLCGEYDRLMTYKENLPGKRFLWYVCCEPDFPNTMLFNSLTEAYLIGVLTAHANMDGFLRWSYCLFPEDVRHDAAYAVFRPGDTHLVYPSRGGEVLLSLRYKALRRGMELYEMLSALREKDPAAAEAALFIVLRERDIRLFFGHGKSPDSLASPDYGDYQRLLSVLADKLTE